MLTIAPVGRMHLIQFLTHMGLPVFATWRHMRTDLETLWEDGSIRDGVAYFLGSLRANGREGKYDITVPVVIREGQLQEPALFRWGERTEVFTKEAIEDLFTGYQFPRVMPAREYLYGFPAPPSVAPPSRTMPDLWTGLR